MRHGVVERQRRKGRLKVAATRRDARLAKGAVQLPARDAIRAADGLQSGLRCAVADVGDGEEGNRLGSRSRRGPWGRAEEAAARSWRKV